MQVKQTVVTKFNHAYASYNQLEFTDQNGDEVQIQMTHDDYLSLSKTINTKADRIRKERAEEAAELVKENEVE
jgi:hypothetical protein